MLDISLPLSSKGFDGAVEFFSRGRRVSRRISRLLGIEIAVLNESLRPAY